MRFSKDRGGWLREWYDLSRSGGMGRQGEASLVVEDGRMDKVERVCKGML